MDIPLTIKRVQRFLGLDDDGIAGKNTWTAIAGRLLPPEAVASPTPTTAPVDLRSEGVIATLLPTVQPYARRLIQAAAAQGITIKVISGLRTYAEQDALYAKGRTEPGGKVTNAKAGFSNHNFGTAFDIGVFDDNGTYVPESPKYRVVGALGKKLGLEWGGDWVSIQDEPHFQLRPVWATGLSETAMITRLRDQKARGTPIFS